MTHLMKIQPMVIPSKSWKPAKIYSKLNLQGKWLSDLGFLPGDNVQVIIENDVMTIKRL